MKRAGTRNIFFLLGLNAQIYAFGLEFVLRQAFGPCWQPRSQGLPVFIGNKRRVLSTYWVVNCGKGLFLCSEIYFA